MEHALSNLHATSGSRLAEGVSVSTSAMAENGETIGENCLLADHVVVSTGCDCDEGVEVDACAGLGGRRDRGSTRPVFGRPHDYHHGLAH